MQKEGEINGAGLVGKYRVASDADGLLMTSASTEIYRDTNNNNHWHLSAGGYVHSSNETVDGSYEVRAKALFPAARTGQFSGYFYDGIPSAMAGDVINPEPTIDKLSSYGYITLFLLKDIWMTI